MWTDYYFSSYYMPDKNYYYYYYYDSKTEQKNGYHSFLSPFLSPPSAVSASFPKRTSPLEDLGDFLDFSDLFLHRRSRSGRTHPFPFCSLLMGVPRLFPLFLVLRKGKGGGAVRSPLHGTTPLWFLLQ